VRTRALAYLELTKPRVTLLLLAVAVLTYFVSAGAEADLRGALTTIGAVGLLASGIFALNQYQERDRDVLASRTRGRPLPNGRLRPVEALAFGLALTCLGVAFAAAVANLLTGLIAVAVAVTYLVVYTPLKYRSVLHLVPGALAGSAPPLMGGAIATGTLDGITWVLAAVLFFWQFPHLMAIEMMYREDYLRAGVRVHPVDRRGAILVISTHVLLLVVSLLPVMMELAGWWYAMGALILGTGFLVFGARVVLGRRPWSARHLLRASILYLPLLFLLLAIG
jgi:protoheme IX farnesyltransferase